MASRIIAITIDCANPERLAKFWAAALGYEKHEPVAEFLTLGDPAGRGPRLLFQRVPEPKQVKDRIHLDLGADDDEAEVARLIGLGATRLERIERPDSSWIVLLDPEGNEFCV